MMNIFVASWFFPPATSSEGIVTYKLLRNSKHQYDVFSSTSRLWGYQAVMDHSNEDNIHCYSIETDKIEDWVEACVSKFEELYSRKQYTCIMTRSMPPESILVGRRIKKKYPEVKWIASFGDPIANNPYELRAYITECLSLSKKEKTQLREALCDENEELLSRWEKRPEKGIQLLCKLKRWENSAIQEADMIIAPSGDQLRYMQGKRGWMHKCLVVPHSFDPLFYGKQERKTDSKIVFSFIGYSDMIFRSLEPLVRAVQYLRENNSPFLDKLEMRFIGNNPRGIQDMVLNYYLDDIIYFQNGVDYYQSLKLMQESDWLLHVDAFFPELHTGGSVFFAGKLADYIGARKPIFALTGKGSPADRIVENVGGISVFPMRISEIATKLENILSKDNPPKLNEEYISQYSACRVAAMFDKNIEKLCGNMKWEPRIRELPRCAPSVKEKLVTICVPAYNVERYLERCIKTLIEHKYAPNIEVLIIDDSSKDQTALIGGSFEMRYPGIVRLIQKKNGGHGSTINSAIQEGHGKYFMVVDGDDWIDSNQFEKLLDMIKKEKINTDIVCSNYHEVNMQSGICASHSQQLNVKYMEALDFENIDLENTYFTLAGSLIKLNILKEMATPLQEHTFYVDVEYILFPIPYLETVTFVDFFIYKYCTGNAEQSIYIPTMVKRYDHHERVLMRVIQYKKEHKMTVAQEKYYNNVLKRLLYTHYALFMVYDEDKNHSYSVGKHFDLFLRKTDPELAYWASKHIPMLKTARRYDFNYIKIHKSFRARIARLKGRIKKRLKSSSIIPLLIYNKFTLKIVKLSFFTEGKGKKFKAILEKFAKS